MGLHETLAQQEYVARQNRRRRLVTACRILLLALLLALWELGARLGYNSQSVKRKQHTRKN